MAVLLNTSLGDIVIDLHTDQCPLTCKNFLKLCRIKYYNNCVFHTVQKDFIVQAGDPTGTGSGGDSVYKFLYGDQARFFNDEIHADLKHDRVGTVAMASAGENLNASQFYITTRGDLDYLDGKHTVFGEVAEGLDTLMRINEAFVDEKGRPFKNIRIKHTYVLDDPFDDPVQLSELIPEKSPELKPPAEGEDVRLEDDWVPMDELLDQEELEKSIRSKEAHSRAVVLEMVGDIPEAEIKPPENVLFVCKLNPVTQEEDLEIIFSRFGKIRSADIIKDYKTGDSLCYAFIEFETQEACEAAYFKMDNVLIDDRRIHVDFSQSVARLWMRYRRFGKKDNDDGEGTSFAPRSKGQGCFNCGEYGHLAKDCPNQALKETMQTLENPKYKLKETEGQYGGTNKRYEMLFEETSGGVHNHVRHKEKGARRHDHERGSSEEETIDKRGSLLPNGSRDNQHTSREHHNSGYRTKEARSHNRVTDEKVKEREREQRHTPSVHSDSRYAQSKDRGDYDNRTGRRDGHKHGDRDGRYAVSGLEKRQREDKQEDVNMSIRHTVSAVQKRHREDDREDAYWSIRHTVSGVQKRHREDEQEDLKSHRHREGKTASRNSHGEYRHDSRREEREERKPRSMERKYAYDKHTRDADRLMK